MLILLNYPPPNFKEIFISSKGKRTQIKRGRETGASVCWFALHISRAAGSGQGRWLVIHLMAGRSSNTGVIFCSFTRYEFSQTSDACWRCR